jgi:alpha-1,6-mannosyltransferase
MWTLQSALLAGGAGLVGACLALGRMPNLVETPRAFLALFGVAFVSYGAGLWGLARLQARGTVPVVLGVALLCRLALLSAPPTLSTDAYRYVWDARVASAGASPYAAAPNADEMAWLRDDVIFPRLNHPTWRTVYPPGAQLFFQAVYALKPDSVLATKAAVALAELFTLGALASLLQALGLPLTRLAVYAWNPLVLVEIWGSGHLDALAVLSCVAAVRFAVSGRVKTGAALLGLGALVKLYPAVLLPLLLQGVVLGPLIVFALVVLLGYAPFAHLGIGALGSLSQYVSTEYFNPGLVRTVIERPTVTMVALVAWIVFATVWRREAPLMDRATVLITGFIVLSPNVFPWYAVWLVPFLALRPSLAPIAFTGTIVLAYTFFLHQPWAIPAWARVTEFLPLAIGAGSSLRSIWIRNGTMLAARVNSRRVRVDPQ